MTLSFGFNVKPKTEEKPQKFNVVKSSIFDDDEEADDGESLNNSHDQHISAEEEITTLDSTSLKDPIDASKPSIKSSKQSSSTPQQPPSRLNPKNGDQTSDLSTSLHTSRLISSTMESDPNIYDYDTYHSNKSAVSSARVAAQKQASVDRTPKYMNSLLDSAARRKQDQLLAKEKLLQKEREAEGDEFADKEKFVTGAYKAQQEENRRVAEEEERRRNEEERRRKGGLGGGMSGFYKGVLKDEEERRNKVDEELKIRLENGDINQTETADEGVVTEKQLADEMKSKGVNVILDDEGRVSDKRQLLSAGLNVNPAGQGNHDTLTDLASSRDTNIGYKNGLRNSQKNAQRERQTRMMEEQIENNNKRAAEIEASELADLEFKAKSKKTQEDKTSARERYLARKKEKEEMENQPDKVVA